MAIFSFYVKDTGPGIPSHLHEAIFDRFYQVEYIKSFGNGFGLTITKKLIQFLGGQIWLQSEERKGTTFFFTLPGNNFMNKKSKETLEEISV